MSVHVYCYDNTTCTMPGQWVVMCIVTITLPVQSQLNERSCVLLPLHYLYNARIMSGHEYCYHYTTCTKPVKWAFMCIVTITLPVQCQDNEWSCVLLPLHYLYNARTMSGHVYWYHYTTCTKPGKWAVMCIVTITLPVQCQNNEMSCVLLPLHYLYKPGKWVVMCMVTITVPVQNQGNERSCVLLPLHYLYKARAMSGHVYCYLHTTCSKPGKWVVMCIITITLPVQSQDNQRSCVLLPLHYLYKARKMKGHVYCYHYTTCTKPIQWAVMCIITITLPVQNQVKERSCVLLPLHYLYKSKDNKRSCVLLPLHYLYKARTMSGHVYCYHYTTCTKPGQWAVMCIVTITLPVQCQDNEWSCVLLPLHYLYKARTISGHVCCYHYTTCTKPRQWAVICIVTITLPVQNQVNERSCVLLPLHYLYKAR